MRHDNVVTVYSVEESQGRPFLVMEFIEGETLRDRVLRTGPLDLEQVLQLGVQIASGLAAAHAKGLIHRDIKPANLLIQSGDGRLKITDFGLARVNGVSGLTQTGDIAGTPEFMSPEQAQGQPVDPRTDLFSLGSVLHTMVTGRSPFVAESAIAVIRRVCDGEPTPLNDGGLELPDWMAAIIGRLLKKDPAERFPNAEAVRHELAERLTLLQSLDPARQGTIPFNATSQRSPDVTSAVAQRTTRQLRRRAVWTIMGVVLCLLGLSESAGFTQVATTVIRLARGDGTLVITVDDPAITVTLNGDKIEIQRDGTKTIYLPPGRYEFVSKKNGLPAKQEVVRMEHRGRRTLDIMFHPKSITSSPAAANPTVAKLDESWSVPVQVNLKADARTILGRPTISGDGLILIFESDRAGGLGQMDLWMCTRSSREAEFGEPVNLGGVNSPERDADPALSADGLILLFGSRRRGREQKMNLLMSTRTSVGDSFGEPVDLGPEVNSSANDYAPCLSADGLTMLFESDRNPGHGRSDLWQSSRPAIDQPFGPPVNLGSEINTPDREGSPHLTADGLTLWFVSDRTGTLGERDLWVSRRTTLQDRFGPPVNAGAAINSEYDEQSPTLTSDGQTLWFESSRSARGGITGLERIWSSNRQKQK